MFSSLFWRVLVGLVLSWTALRAQPSAPVSTYSDVRKGYRLTYPADWQVYQAEDQSATVFYAGPAREKAPAAVALTVRALPAAPRGPNPLSSGAAADSLRGRIQRLPESQLIRLEPGKADGYEELRYDYSYAAPNGRTFVLGRRLWRDGYVFELEYRASAAQHARYRVAGRRLLEAFVLTTPTTRASRPGPAAPRPDQPCDDKMYGIAALRYHDGRWDDDCRTIHEFRVSDPTARPKVHHQVLPFQSYALTKGFDNCLYSVTKAPSDAPELVYRYDPARREGSYTAWQLPAQGPENVWISAATDERGDLYFITSDGALLVRVRPAADSVQVVWRADPLRRASYYRAVAFPGAGTHANFCLDDAQTVWQVNSADGSLLKIDLPTQSPAADITPVEGLPRRGGYSDVLIQNDAQGRRVFYLAGAKSLYQVDPARRQAALVRRGSYTDLAGCNLFQGRPAPAAPPAWRGRVLDALTRQPLPRAELRRGRNGQAPAPVKLPPSAAFSFPIAAAGEASAIQVRLPGYLPLDTLYLARPDSAGQDRRDILLRPLRVGATLPLRNVQFEQGRALLLPSSFAALNELLTLLIANPSLRIELRGHTDNVGDPQKNVVLSQQRVAAVKAYLVSHGVAAERISGLGLGGAEPRASNAREETRQLNRRVEFRVTGVR